MLKQTRAQVALGWWYPSVRKGAHCHLGHHYAKTGCFLIYLSKGAKKFFWWPFFCKAYIIYFDNFPPLFSTFQKIFPNTFISTKYIEHLNASHNHIRHRAPSLPGRYHDCKGNIPSIKFFKYTQIRRNQDIVGIYGRYFAAKTCLLSSGNVNSTISLLRTSA